MLEASDVKFDVWKDLDSQELREFGLIACERVSKIECELYQEWDDSGLLDKWLKSVKKITYQLTEGIRRHDLTTLPPRKMKPKSAN